MSNVFNQELYQAIKAVYTELEAKEQIQENLEKAAKLNVYYAHASPALLELLEKNGIDTTEALAIEQMASKKESLQKSLQTALTAAKTKVKLAFTASESANKEMNKAKEELNLVQAKLNALEASLVAAEAAGEG